MLACLLLSLSSPESPLQIMYGSRAISFSAATPETRASGPRRPQCLCAGHIIATAEEQSCAHAALIDGFSHAPACASCLMRKLGLQTSESVAHNRVLVLRRRLLRLPTKPAGKARQASRRSSDGRGHVFPRQPLRYFRLRCTGFVVPHSSHALLSSHLSRAIR